MCYNHEEKCHVVTKICHEHSNHAVDEELADRYPEFRRPSDDTVQEVQKLLDYEVRTGVIRDMVLRSGIKATAQDIQNLRYFDNIQDFRNSFCKVHLECVSFYSCRNKWLDKFKGKRGSPEDAVFEELRKIKEEDPGSVVAIQYDPETFVIHSVFFQWSEMRDALQKYPEVLIMDTTYKLSDNDMPLVVFEVVDCFGAGRVAGYALIMSESKDIVSGALSALKIGMENLTERVESVFVDRAESEIVSIKEILPNAEIHLCDYHVKNAIQRSGEKKELENWDEIYPIVKKMIHAQTKEIYDKAYEELKVAAGGDESPFMKYFNKRWHNSDLIWTEFRRNMFFTLGERTTGRLECHNAKIKMWIQKRLPPAQVISRLRIMHKVSYNENDHRVFESMAKTRYNKYSKDPVVQKILKINTPFIGDILKRQYERSLEPPSHNVHEVTLEKCDCADHTKYRLPCSHIFRERRLQGGYFTLVC